jgi:hypothetical protein
MVGSCQQQACPPLPTPLQLFILPASDNISSSLGLYSNLTIYFKTNYLKLHFEQSFSSKS